MRRTYGGRIAVFAAVIISGLIGAQASGGQSQSTYTGLPSEMPARIEPVTSSFDYVRREMMIPMRDGVRLHTVILVPKGAKSAGILLTRTPYDADAQTNHAASAHLGPALSGYDNATEGIVEGGDNLVGAGWCGEDGCGSAISGKLTIPHRPSTQPSELTIPTYHT